MMNKISADRKYKIFNVRAITPTKETHHNVSTEKQYISWQWPEWEEELQGVTKSSKKINNLNGRSTTVTNIRKQTNMEKSHVTPQHTINIKATSTEKSSKEHMNLEWPEWDEKEGRTKNSKIVKKITTENILKSTKKSTEHYLKFQWPEEMEMDQNHSKKSKEYSAPRPNTSTQEIVETEIAKSFSSSTSRDKTYEESKTGWVGYNWDVEHTRRENENVINTENTPLELLSEVKPTTSGSSTKKEEHETASTTKINTSEKNPMFQATGISENIIIGNYEISTETEIPMGSPVEGSNEMEKKKLYSIADDLLNSSNFEATLGTTGETKISMNEMVGTVSESSEVKDYYERVSNILKEETIHASEGYTEIDSDEKKKLYSAADVLEKDESMKLNPYIKSTTNIIPTKIDLNNDWETMSDNKGFSEKGWSKFNWDVEHTRITYTPLETSTSSTLKATARSTPTTVITATTPPIHKETGYEIIDKDNEIELPTVEVNVLLENTEQISTPDYFEINAGNDPEHEYKKKLFSFADFLLDAKNFEGTLSTTKEQTKLILNEVYFTENEDIDYDNTKITDTSEYFTNIDEKDKELLYSVADELLKEQPNKGDNELKNTSLQISMKHDLKESTSPGLTKKNSDEFLRSTKGISELNFGDAYTRGTSSKSEETIQLSSKQDHSWTEEKHTTLIPPNNIIFISSNRTNVIPTKIQFETSKDINKITSETEYTYNTDTSIIKSKTDHTKLSTEILSELVQKNQSTSKELVTKMVLDKKHFRTQAGFDFSQSKTRTLTRIELEKIPEQHNSITPEKPPDLLRTTDAGKSLTPNTAETRNYHRGYGEVTNTANSETSQNEEEFEQTELNLMMTVTKNNTNNIPNDMYPEEEIQSHATKKLQGEPFSIQYSMNIRPITTEANKEEMVNRKKQTSKDQLNTRTYSTNIESTEIGTTAKGITNIESSLTKYEQTETVPETTVNLNVLQVENSTNKQFDIEESTLHTKFTQNYQIDNNHTNDLRTKSELENTKETKMHLKHTHILNDTITPKLIITKTEPEKYTKKGSLEESTLGSLNEIEKNTIIYCSTEPLTTRLRDNIEQLLRKNGNEEVTEAENIENTLFSPNVETSSEKNENPEIPTSQISKLEDIGTEQTTIKEKETKLPTVREYTLPNQFTKSNKITISQYESTKNVEETTESEEQLNNAEGTSKHTNETSKTTISDKKTEIEINTEYEIVDHTTTKYIEENTATGNQKESYVNYNTKEQHISTGRISEMMNKTEETSIKNGGPSSTQYTTSTQPITTTANVLKEHRHTNLAFLNETTPLPSGNKYQEEVTSFVVASKIPNEVNITKNEPETTQFATTNYKQQYESTKNNLKYTRKNMGEMTSRIKQTSRDHLNTRIYLTNIESTEIGTTAKSITNIESSLTKYEQTATVPETTVNLNVLQVENSTNKQFDIEESTLHTKFAQNYRIYNNHTNDLRTKSEFENTKETKMHLKHTNLLNDTITPKLITTKTEPEKYTKKGYPEESTLGSLNQIETDGSNKINKQTVNNIKLYNTSESENGTYGEENTVIYCSTEPLTTRLRDNVEQLLRKNGNKEVTEAKNIENTQFSPNVETSSEENKNSEIPTSQILKLEDTGTAQSTIKEETNLPTVREYTLSNQFTKNNKITTSQFEHTKTVEETTEPEEQLNNAEGTSKHTNETNKTTISVSKEVGTENGYEISTQFTTNATEFEVGELNETRFYMAHTSKIQPSVTSTSVIKEKNSKIHITGSEQKETLMSKSPIPKTTEKETEIEINTEYEIDNHTTSMYIEENTVTGNQKEGYVNYNTKEHHISTGSISEMMNKTEETSINNGAEEITVLLNTGSVPLTYNSESSLKEFDQTEIISTTKLQEEHTEKHKKNKFGTTSSLKTELLTESAQFTANSEIIDTSYNYIVRTESQLENINETNIFTNHTQGIHTYTATKSNTKEINTKQYNNKWSLGGKQKMLTSQIPKTENTGKEETVIEIDHENEFGNPTTTNYTTQSSVPESKKDWFIDYTKEYYSSSGIISGTISNNTEEILNDNGENLVTINLNTESIKETTNLESSLKIFNQTEISSVETSVRLEDTNNKFETAKFSTTEEFTLNTQFSENSEIIKEHHLKTLTTESQLEKMDKTTLHMQHTTNQIHKSSVSNELSSEVFINSESVNGGPETLTTQIQSVNTEEIKTKMNGNNEYTVGNRINIKHNETTEYEEEEFSKRSKEYHSSIGTVGSTIEAYNIKSSLKDYEQTEITPEKTSRIENIESRKNTKQEFKRPESSTTGDVHELSYSRRTQTYPHVPTKFENHTEAFQFIEKSETISDIITSKKTTEQQENITKPLSSVILTKANNQLTTEEQLTDLLGVTENEPPGHFPPSEETTIKIDVEKITEEDIKHTTKKHATLGLITNKIKIGHTNEIHATSVTTAEATTISEFIDSEIEYNIDTESDNKESVTIHSQDEVYNENVDNIHNASYTTKAGSVHQVSMTHPIKTTFKEITKAENNTHVSNNNQFEEMGLENTTKTSISNKSQNEKESLQIEKGSTETWERKSTQVSKSDQSISAGYDRITTRSQLEKINATQLYMRHFNGMNETIKSSINGKEISTEEYARKWSLSEEQTELLTSQSSKLGKTEKDVTNKFKIGNWTTASTKRSYSTESSKTTEERETTEFGTQVSIKNQVNNELVEPVTEPSTENVENIFPKTNIQTEVSATIFKTQMLETSNKHESNTKKSSTETYVYKQTQLFGNNHAINEQITEKNTTVSLKESSKTKEEQQFKFSSEEDFSLCKTCTEVEAEMSLTSETSESTNGKHTSEKNTGKYTGQHSSSVNNQSTNQINELEKMTEISPNGRQNVNTNQTHSTENMQYISLSPNPSNVTIFTIHAKHSSHQMVTEIENKTAPTSRAQKTKVESPLTATATTKKISQTSKTPVPPEYSRKEHFQMETVTKEVENNIEINTEANGTNTAETTEIDYWSLQSSENILKETLEVLKQTATQSTHSTENLLNTKTYSIETTSLNKKISLMENENNETVSSTKFSYTKPASTKIEYLEDGHNRTKTTRKTTLQFLTAVKSINESNEYTTERIATPDNFNKDEVSKLLTITEPSEKITTEGIDTQIVSTKYGVQEPKNATDNNNIIENMSVTKKTENENPHEKSTNAIDHHSVEIQENEDNKKTTVIETKRTTISLQESSNFNEDQLFRFSADENVSLCETCTETVSETLPTVNPYGTTIRKLEKRTTHNRGIELAEYEERPQEEQIFNFSEGEEASTFCELCAESYNVDTGEEPKIEKPEIYETTKIREKMPEQTEEEKVKHPITTVKNTHKMKNDEEEDNEEHIFNFSDNEESTLCEICAAEGNTKENVSTVHIQTHSQPKSTEYYTTTATTEEIEKELSTIETHKITSKKENEYPTSEKVINHDTSEVTEEVSNKYSEKQLSRLEESVATSLYTSVEENNTTESVNLNTIHHGSTEARESTENGEEEKQEIGTEENNTEHISQTISGEGFTEKNEETINDHEIATQEHGNITTENEETEENGTTYQSEESNAMESTENGEEEKQEIGTEEMNTEHISQTSSTEEFTEKNEETINDHGITTQEHGTLATENEETEENATTYHSELSSVEHEETTNDLQLSTQEHGTSSTENEKTVETTIEQTEESSFENEVIVNDHEGMGTGSTENEGNPTIYQNEESSIKHIGSTNEQEKIERESAITEQMIEQSSEYREALEVLTDIGIVNESVELNSVTEPNNITHNESVLEDMFENNENTVSYENTVETIDTEFVESTANMEEIETSETAINSMEAEMTENILDSEKEVAKTEITNEIENTENMETNAEVNAIIGSEETTETIENQHIESTESKLNEHEESVESTIYTKETNIENFTSDINNLSAESEGQINSEGDNEKESTEYVENATGTEGIGSNAEQNETTESSTDNEFNENTETIVNSKKETENDITSENISSTENQSVTYTEIINETENTEYVENISNTEQGSVAESKENMETIESTNYEVNENTETFESTAKSNEEVENEITTETITENQVSENSEIVESTVPSIEEVTNIITEYTENFETTVIYNTAEIEITSENTEHGVAISTEEAQGTENTDHTENVAPQTEATTSSEDEVNGTTTEYQKLENSEGNEEIKETEIETSESTPEGTENQFAVSSEGTSEVSITNHIETNTEVAESTETKGTGKGTNESIEITGNISNEKTENESSERTDNFEITSTLNEENTQESIETENTFIAEFSKTVESTELAKNTESLQATDETETIGSAKVSESNRNEEVNKSFGGTNTLEGTEGTEKVETENIENVSQGTEITEEPTNTEIPSASKLENTENMETSENVKNSGTVEGNTNIENTSENRDTQTVENAATVEETENIENTTERESDSNIENTEITKIVETTEITESSENTSSETLKNTNVAVEIENIKVNENTQNSESTTNESNEEITNVIENATTENTNISERVGEETAENEITESIEGSTTIENSMITKNVEITESEESYGSENTLIETLENIQTTENVESIEKTGNIENSEITENVKNEEITGVIENGTKESSGNVENETVETGKTGGIENDTNIENEVTTENLEITEERYGTSENMATQTAENTKTPHKTESVEGTENSEITENNKSGGITDVTENGPMKNTRISENIEEETIENEITGNTEGSSIIENAATTVEITEFEESYGTSENVHSQTIENTKVLEETRNIEGSTKMSVGTGNVENEESTQIIENSPTENTITSENVDEQTVESKRTESIEENSSLKNTGATKNAEITGTEASYATSENVHINTEETAEENSQNSENTENISEEIVKSEETVESEISESIEKSLSIANTGATKNVEITETEASYGTSENIHIHTLENTEESQKENSESTKNIGEKTVESGMLESIEESSSIKNTEEASQNVKTTETEESYKTSANIYTQTLENTKTSEEVDEENMQNSESAENVKNEEITGNTESTETISEETVESEISVEMTETEENYGSSENMHTGTLENTKTSKGSSESAEKVKNGEITENIENSTVENARTTENISEETVESEISEKINESSSIENSEATKNEEITEIEESRGTSESTVKSNEEVENEITTETITENEVSENSEIMESTVPSIEEDTNVITEYTENFETTVISNTAEIEITSENTEHGVAISTEEAQGTENTDHTENVAPQTEATTSSEDEVNGTTTEYQKLENSEGNEIKETEIETSESTPEGTENQIAVIAEGTSEVGFTNHVETNTEVAESTERKGTDEGTNEGLEITGNISNENTENESSERTDNFEITTTLNEENTKIGESRSTSENTESETFENQTTEESGNIAETESRNNFESTENVKSEEISEVIENTSTEIAEVSQKVIEETIESKTTENVERTTSIENAAITENVGTTETEESHENSQNIQTQTLENTKTSEESKNVEGTENTQTSENIENVKSEEITRNIENVTENTAINESEITENIKETSEYNGYTTISNNRTTNKTIYKSEKGTETSIGNNSETTLGSHSIPENTMESTLDLQQITEPTNASMSENILEELETDAIKLLTEAGILDESFDLLSITEGTNNSEINESTKLASTSVITHVKNGYIITSKYMSELTEKVSEAAKDENLFNFSTDQEGTTLCEICSEVEGGAEQGHEESSEGNTENGTNKPGESTGGNTENETNKPAESTGGNTENGTNKPGESTGGNTEKGNNKPGEHSGGNTEKATNKPGEPSGGITEKGTQKPGESSQKGTEKGAHKPGESTEGNAGKTTQGSGESSQISKITAENGGAKGNTGKAGTHKAGESNEGTTNVVAESTTNKEGQANSKTSPEPGHTKTLVVVVNNSGSKLEKLNKTVLEKLLKKPASDLNLEYLDLDNLSQASSASNDKSKSLEKVLPNTPTVSCNKNDFESSNNCLCDVDDYLTIIENRIEKGENITLKENLCNKFLRLSQGLIIGNNTKPTKRRRRSLLFLSNMNGKSDVIESDDIENVFPEEYDLQTSDKLIFTLPGSDVKIPCHTKADNEFENKGARYTWEFISDESHEGDALPGNENILVLHNIDIKNYGNYSCTKITENSVKESFKHELEIITFPIYKTDIRTFYSINGSCSLKDGDLLYTYLPDLTGSLLCGPSRRMCKVDMQRPRCISKEEDTFFNITLTATMNPINNIFSKVDSSKCDINCKLKVYSNMVELLYKNAKMVQQISVTSKLDDNLSLTPRKAITESSSNLNTKPPRVITTCQGGYGIEKDRQRICILCPKHTYSDDDEAFCKVCPAGQYQSIPGSKTCVMCSSPVDDSMCLRMLYSDTKLFKIYVGVAFGMVVVIILILVYWSSSGRGNRDGIRFEGSLKHRAMKRRDGDIECAALEPLLIDQGVAKKRRLPPRLPPPDF